MADAWLKVLQTQVVSLLVAVFVFAAAWVIATKADPIPVKWQTNLQAIGAFLVFWGVYAKVGWGVQTFDGNTPPEVFNEWFFRVITGLGTVCIAYATFARVKAG